jgi:hypothetical protein
MFHIQRIFWNRIYSKEIRHITLVPITQIALFAGMPVEKSIEMKRMFHSRLQG